MLVLCPIILDYATCRSLPITVELDIFTVILFSLYSRLVNNREINNYSTSITILLNLSCNSEN